MSRRVFLRPVLGLLAAAMLLVVVAAPGAAGTFTQQELIASDAQSGDLFGGLVAINGSTLAVGAPGKNSSAGAAYVFVQSGGTWSQRAELTASDSVVGDEFGSAVVFASSGDGQPELIVGAQGKNSSTGAVYVFIRSGSSWLQQQVLTASDGNPGDLFGWDTKVSGSSLLVIAPGKSSNTGAAYVFVQSGQNWIQQAELTASDGTAGDTFGFAGAISGPTVVVGAPNKSLGAGAAYVFNRTGGTWAQQQELTAPDAAAVLFGRYVVTTGSTAVVDAGGLGGGVAYVFTRTAGVMSLQQRLRASDEVPGDRFGLGMAIDDSSLVLGAPGKNSFTGAAYVFTSGDSGWTQQAEFTPLDGAAGDLFGLYVAVSGSTVLVGAPVHAGAGAAYVFTH